MKGRQGKQYRVSEFSDWIERIKNRETFKNDLDFWGK